MNTSGTLSVKHLSAVPKNKMLYLLVIGIIICETIALSMLKEYAISSNILYYTLGLLFYVGVTALLVKSFAYEGIGVVNVLWSSFSIVLVVSMGVIFFRETITFLECVGISMVLGGVAVLRIFGA